MNKSVYANLVEICPSVLPSSSPFLAASLIPRLLISPRSRSLSKSLARRSNERGTNAHYQYAEQSQAAVRSLSRPAPAAWKCRTSQRSMRIPWRLLGTHATLCGILVSLLVASFFPFLLLQSVGKQNMHQRDRQHLNVTMKSIRCRVTFLLRFFFSLLSLTGIFRRLETDQNTSSSDLESKDNRGS